MSMTTVQGIREVLMRREVILPVDESASMLARRALNATIPPPELRQVRRGAFGSERDGDECGGARPGYRRGWVRGTTRPGYITLAGGPGAPYGPAPSERSPRLCAGDHEDAAGAARAVRRADSRRAPPVEGRAGGGAALVRTGLQVDGGLGAEAPWLVTEPDRDGRAPRDPARPVPAVGEDGGGPSIPLHAARHTYAEIALAAGVRLDVVSRALGHSSISTTANIYTHDNDAAGPRLPTSWAERSRGG